MDFPIPSAARVLAWKVRDPFLMNEVCISVLLPIGPDSKSMDSRSLDPRNQRTMPLILPTEFLSELDVESERSALSLCLGVSVGLVGKPFRR